MPLLPEIADCTRLLPALVGIAMLLPFYVCADQEAENWQKLDQEFPQTEFAQQFVDSLRKVNDVKPTKRLRKLKGPLYLRRETFAYAATWGFMRAGYGVLRQIPDSAQGMSRITIKGASTDFVSAFYKVRDCITSTIDAAGFYPFFFQEHIQEGRYKAKRWVLYDQKRHVVYTNKKGAEMAPSAPFALDFLSLLWVVRSRTLAPGDTFTIDCFVHGKSYPVFFQCWEREKVEVEAGTFSCLRVEPRMVGEGRNFSKKDRLQLWLTDDEYHVPVLVKTKIKVGSVRAELIHRE